MTLHWPDERFSWIDHRPPAGREDELAAIHLRIGAPANGDGLDHVLRIHGPLPHTLEQHLAFYRGILRDEGPLTRVEREILGVVVSSRNGCLY